MKGMRIGMMAGEGSGDAPDVAWTLANVRRFEALELDTAWLANIAVDALTAAAVAGAQTVRIEIATGVVPTPPRHPFALAQQAVTTQAACGGRLTLGVGLSHRIMIEDMLGLSYARPARQMRETLEVLVPLLRGDGVQFDGELYRAHSGPLAFAPPTEVLVAALGPKMLELTGQLARGTVTWATGLKTLEGYVGPTLRAAAAAAGRPEPRLAAGFPIVVTANVARAHETAARIFAVYKTLPSYRAMMDREGVAGVEDLLICGDEAEVRHQLERLRDAGVSDFCGFSFDVDDGDRERTARLLGELSG